MDRVGRKPLLACGAAQTATGVCMLALATVGVLFAQPLGEGSGSAASEGGGGGGGGVVISERSAGAVCILSIYGFVSAFAYSWGPVVWALCTEIFPTCQRARGVAITTTTNWLWNIAIGQFFPPVQRRMGFLVFYIFGFASLLLGWTVARVPETKGLSIDQVQQLFDRPTDLLSDDGTDTPPLRRISISRRPDATRPLQSMWGERGV